MPNPLNVPITPPRVAFIDSRTGTVSREWYLFFLSLFQSQGGSSISLDDVQKGPPVLTVDEINANISKVAENLRPSTESVVEQIAELQKQIEGMQESSESCCVNDIAELQKQIQALAVQVQPQLGTLSAVNIDWVPYLGFDTAPPWIGTTAGQFWFDSTTGSFNAKMGNNNITQQVGEEIFVYGKASATITDSPLQIIRKTGTVGASGVITFGPTVSGMTDPNAIIGVATESLATNSFGRITAFGVVHGITTNGTAFGEVWADNDDIWYNPTTGNPTNVKPSAPGIKVQIGTVIKAGNGGSGSFQVLLQPGSVLGGTDSNVEFSTLANGDLIQYDSALGYWKNVTPASVINASGGAPVTKTANFTVAASETWLINNKSGSSCTVTLPSASTNTGRVLHFQNYQAQTLVSDSSNVVPLVGGAAGTAILAAVTGDTCTLVSDGTNWIMTQYVPNNVLLLE